MEHWTCSLHRGSEKFGPAKTLVVILHGWIGSAKTMMGLRDAVMQDQSQANLGGADVLVPQYEAGPLSNNDPYEPVEFLLKEIDSIFERPGKPYEDVILVGVSIGGLLIRKAYVYACGEVEDDLTSGVRRRKDWVDKVRRIILLAGLTRGWSIDLKRKPQRGRISFLRRLGLFLAGWIARWAGIGTLIASFRRGTPFVTNLRLQWLDLIRRGVGIPPTIQIVGTRDDIVGKEDQRDVEAGETFIYRVVPGTAHENLSDFIGEFAELRRSEFLYALLTPTGKLKGTEDVRFSRDPNVQRVVFLMHGIRDFGHWTTNLGQKVKDTASELNLRVEVVQSGYGFFSMAAFLLLGARQAKVRWFVDQYTEQFATYPNATFSFMGHSNGTYLLASALQHYKVCAFDNVIFGGSVVPTSFDWSKYIRERRINRIQNYVASEDWVVAIFPGLFEQLHLEDIGAAAHNGFTDTEAQKYQIEYIEGDHGAALKDVLFPRIASFVLGEPGTPPNPRYVRDQKGWVKLAGRLCWLVWLMLIAVLVGLPILASLWIHDVRVLFVYFPILIALLCTF